MLVRWVIYYKAMQADVKFSFTTYYPLPVPSGPHTADSMIHEQIRNALQITASGLMSSTPYIFSSTHCSSRSTKSALRPFVSKLRAVRTSFSSVTFILVISPELTSFFKAASVRAELPSSSAFLLAGAVFVLFFGRGSSSSSASSSRLMAFCSWCLVNASLATSAHS